MTAFIYVTETWSYIDRDTKERCHKSRKRMINVGQIRSIYPAEGYSDAGLAKAVIDVGDPGYRIAVEESFNFLHQLITCLDVRVAA